MKNPGVFATACAAINCDIKKDNHPYKFYSFPSDSARCKLWVIKCRRLDLFSIPPDFLSKSYSLCEKHFTYQCFLPMSNDQSEIEVYSHSLLEDAVPTLFDFPTVKYSAIVDCLEREEKLIPGGIQFKMINRTIIMDDGKVFLCGGPLLNPGSVSLCPTSQFLVKPKDPNCGEENENQLISSYAPVFISIIPTFKSVCLVKSLELFNVYIPYTFTKWMASVNQHLSDGMIPLDNCEIVKFITDKNCHSHDFTGLRQCEEVFFERNQLNTNSFTLESNHKDMVRRVEKEKYVAVAPVSLPLPTLQSDIDLKAKLVSNEKKILSNLQRNNSDNRNQVSIIEYRQNVSNISNSNLSLQTVPVSSSDEISDNGIEFVSNTHSDDMIKMVSKNIAFLKKTNLDSKNENLTNTNKYSELPIICDVFSLQKERIQGGNVSETMETNIGEHFKSNDLKVASSNISNQTKSCEDEGSKDNEQLIFSNIKEQRVLHNAPDAPLEKHIKTSNHCKLNKQRAEDHLDQNTSKTSSLRTYSRSGCIINSLADSNSVREKKIKSKSNFGKNLDQCYIKSNKKTASSLMDEVQSEMINSQAIACDATVSNLEPDDSLIMHDLVCEQEPKLNIDTTVDSDNLIPTADLNKDVNIKNNFLKNDKSCSGNPNNTKHPKNVLGVNSTLKPHKTCRQLLRRVSRCRGMYNSGVKNAHNNQSKVIPSGANVLNSPLNELLCEMNKMPISDNLKNRLKMTLNRKDSSMSSSVTATRKLISIPISNTQEHLQTNTINELLSKILGSNTKVISTLTEGENSLDGKEIKEKNSINLITENSEASHCESDLHKQKVDKIVKSLTAKRRKKNDQKPNSSTLMDQSKENYNVTTLKTYKPMKSTLENMDNKCKSLKSWIEQSQSKDKAIHRIKTCQQTNGLIPTNQNLPIHIKNIIKNIAAQSSKVMVFREKVSTSDSQYEYSNSPINHDKNLERYNLNSEGFPNEVILGPEKCAKLSNVPLDYEFLPMKIKDMITDVSKIVLIKECKFEDGERNCQTISADNDILSESSNEWESVQSEIVFDSDLNVVSEKTNNSFSKTSEFGFNKNNETNKNWILKDTKMTELSLDDNSIPDPLKKLIHNVSPSANKVMIVNDTNILNSADSSGGVTIPHHIKELIQSVVPNSGKVILLEGKNISGTQWSPKGDRSNSIPLSSAIMKLKRDTTDVNEIFTSITSAAIPSFPSLPNKNNTFKKTKCFCNENPLFYLKNVTETRLDSLPNSLKDLGNFILNLKRSVAKFKKKSARLQKKINFLKTHPPKIKFEHLMGELCKYLKPEAYSMVLTTAQQSSSPKAPNGMRYTEEMKRIAAKIIIIGGTNIYRYLSSIFMLPSKRYMQRFLASSIANLEREAMLEGIPLDTSDTINIQDAIDTVVNSDTPYMQEFNETEDIVEINAPPNAFNCQFVPKSCFNDFNSLLLFNKQRIERQKRKWAEKNNKVPKKMKKEKNETTEVQAISEFSKRPRNVKSKKMCGPQSIDSTFYETGDVTQYQELHSYSKQLPSPNSCEPSTSQGRCSSTKKKSIQYEGLKGDELSVDELRRYELLEAIEMISGNTNESRSAHPYNRLIQEIVMNEDGVNDVEESSNDTVEVIIEENFDLMELVHSQTDI